MAGFVSPAPNPVPGKLTSREARRLASTQNAFATLPEAAFTEPLYEYSSLFSRGVLLNEPRAIRRVLVEKPEKYLKGGVQFEALRLMLGDGIVISDGETWRAHRKAMAPAFGPRAIETYIPGIVSTVGDFFSSWSELARGEPINLGEAMTDLALRLITRTTYAGDGEKIAELMLAALRSADEVVRDIGLSDFLPVLSHLRARRRRALIRHHFRALDEEIFRLLAVRREGAPGHNGDLVDRLLAARDETGRALTDTEIRDELVTIFVAGHETTATALMWTVYLIAQHPEVEERIAEELDQELGANALDTENLERLTYMKMCLEESMRILPPVPRLIVRRAAEADELCGRPIRKGTYVTIFPWVLHRHLQLWANPEAFDPERFEPTQSVARDRFAYLPFGAGPRICIGAALATIQMRAALAEMMRRFRVTLAPGPPVILRPEITLMSKAPIQILIEPRSAAAGEPRATGARS